MKNPRFTNPDNTGIILDLDETGSICLFAEPTGDYAQVFSDATEGKFGEVAPYQPYQPTPDEINTQLATEVRTKRNALLQQSDWTQVADAPVDQAVWATYRQALRDVTTQEGFPESVVWPVAPN